MNNKNKNNYNNLHVETHPVRSLSAGFHLEDDNNLDDYNLEQEETDYVLEEEDNLDDNLEEDLLDQDLDNNLDQDFDPTVSYTAFDYKRPNKPVDTPNLLLQAKRNYYQDTYYKPAKKTKKFLTYWDLVKVMIVCYILGVVTGIILVFLLVFR